MTLGVPGILFLLILGVYLYFRKSPSSQLNALKQEDGKLQQQQIDKQKEIEVTKQAIQTVTKEQTENKNVEDFWSKK